jgi:hypothetical protein
MTMGDKITTLALYAIMGAILGDMLIHVQGTNALFSGLGNLATSTYKAAGGAYSTSPN